MGATTGVQLIDRSVVQGTQTNYKRLSLGMQVMTIGGTL